MIFGLVAIRRAPIEVDVRDFGKSLSDMVYPIAQSAV